MEKIHQEKYKRMIAQRNEEVAKIEAKNAALRIRQKKYEKMIEEVISLPLSFFSFSDQSISESRNRSNNVKAAIIN